MARRAPRVPSGAERGADAGPAAPRSGAALFALWVLEATSGMRRCELAGAKIDWKALSQRIGHADVAFTMKQYVQTDLEADRQVANTLAELIIGGSLTSFEITGTAREASERT
jgi:hypothetical protein